MLMDNNKKNVAVFCKPNYTEDFQDVQTSEKNTIENMLGNREVIQKVNPILVIDSDGKDLLEKFFSRSLVECQKIIDEKFETCAESIKEYINSSELPAKNLREDFISVGQDIKISEPLNYKKFIKNLENFYGKTEKIFPQLNTLNKYLERFKFMKKVGIKLNDKSDSAYINIAKQIFEKINDMTDHFTLMGEYRSERIDRRLRLFGCIIGTSDLCSESSDLNQWDEIVVNSVHSLLLDQSITASGANLTFLSPYWFKKSNISIDLSGKDGERVTGIQTSREGRPGNPGCPGGNFYGHCNAMFSEGNLNIISNGGRGSNGTNGTTGAQGIDGYDIEDPEFVSENTEEYTFNTKKIKIYRIAKRGERGAQGYSGGARGLGGNRGSITFNLLQEINTVTENGRDGAEGMPGAGGLGGLYPDIQETFEDHNETSFGKVKRVVLRRLAQTGMGIVSVGIVPLYTGISALVNTHSIRPNNENISDENVRAPSGTNRR